MKILKQSYEILTPISEGGIEELKLIESIARECYKSNDKIQTMENLLKSLFQIL